MIMIKIFDLLPQSPKILLLDTIEVKDVDINPVKNNEKLSNYIFNGNLSITKMH